MMDDASGLDCEACGACCAFSSTWPRFSLETDEQLAAIPPELVSDDLSGMRCVGDRCGALSGVVGVETGCTIYGLRPQVCRQCTPGDAECAMARAAFGLDGAATGALRRQDVTQAERTDRRWQG